MQAFFKKQLPAYCIPKVVRMETGEVLYEKVYMSPRLSTKDLLEKTTGKENWVQNTLGSYLEVSNRNQPILNPIRDEKGETRYQG